MFLKGLFMVVDTSKEELVTEPQLFSLLIYKGLYVLDITLLCVVFFLENFCLKKDGTVEYIIFTSWGLVNTEYFSVVLYIEFAKKDFSVDLKK